MSGTARLVLEDREHFFLSSHRGFLPRCDPSLSLPPEFATWDQAAARLPELYQEMTVRSLLEGLPFLPADLLSETQLWRAATVLGVLAHAYWRSQPEPPAQLPAALLQSWQGVCARLGRESPFLAYAELILGNWRRRDLANPSLDLENLELLVPTIGNQAERVFYLTQVEIAARSAPLVSGIIRAQEACALGGWEEVEKELEAMLSILRYLTERTLPKIDLNEYSPTYVDPILWAKTVGPFAVPLRPGVPGPGGTAAPTFHLLDAFFSRQVYESPLGKESRRLNEVAPEAWQRLTAAVAEFSLASRLIGPLRPLLDQVYQAYAGPDGLLAAHRLKAHGYLEIAFKLGRSVTLGGFRGLFRDRTWDKIDEELERSQAERLSDAHLDCHFASVGGGRVIEHGNQEWTCYLDLEAPELRWRPGDLVAVLPEHSDALVARTLAALGAPPGTRVPLDPLWKSAVKLRDGFQDAECLPLEQFLRFARIRPLERETALRLYRLSAAPFLREMVDSASEDQWELWDVLEKLKQTGFDPRQLWRARPGEPESMCRLVPPEVFRPYSAWRARPGLLSLRVMGLTYRSSKNVSPEARRGTCSHYLRRLAEGESQRRISFRFVPGSRFRPPDEPAQPIVMFAGGSGVSPFLGFLAERGQGANWLLASFHTPEELGQADRLARWWAEGRLRLDVAFSKAAVGISLNPEGPNLEFPPARPSHLPELMALRAEDLRSWLLPVEQGGRGAHVYVCGRPQFASMVWTELSQLLGVEFLRRMVAAGRLQQDVFTVYSGPGSGRQFDLSEIVRHNGSQGETWTLIGQQVYDLSEFRHIHPGGEKLLAAYAGCDATHAYRGMRHHLNPHVHSWLGLYAIGALRPLKLGSTWVGKLYRRWARALSLVVEIENAARLDLGPLPPGPCRLALAQLVEAHRRFQANLEGLFQDEFPPLWEGTSGDESGARQTFAEQVKALDSHPARRWGDSMSTRPDLVETERIRLTDLGYIEKLKDALWKGVVLFEVHEAEILKEASNWLLGIVAALPGSLKTYLDELAGPSTGQDSEAAEGESRRSPEWPGHGYSWDS